MVTKPCICHERKPECDCDEEERMFRVHPKAVLVCVILLILFTAAMAYTATL